MHHEIRTQKASSSASPTTGSSGGPMATDPRIASHRASRERAIFDRRPCRHCTLTGSASSAMHKRTRPAAQRRMNRNLPGPPPAPCCAAGLAREERHKPWKYRWAGAATPTQRSTTRPHKPPGRASDVFYGSNLYRKDNPRWAISNVTESSRAPSDLIRFAGGICVAWLIGLPRRAGAKLHAMNDEESRWWHWLVTERHGGLARQYRDARFETLLRDPALRRDELTDPD